MFQVQGTFVDNIYYADITQSFFTLEEPPISPIANVIIRCSWFTMGLGYSLFFLFYEKIMKRTKYLITLFQLSITVLEIIMPFGLAGSLFSIDWVLGPLIALVIIFYFTKWSQPEFKAVSAFLLFGYALLNRGMFLRDIPDLGQPDVFPLTISPILMIIGALITLIPTIVNPKFLHKSLIYFIVFGVLIVVLDLSILSYFIYLHVTQFFIIAISVLIPVGIYFYIRIILIIKSEKSLAKETKIKKDAREFLVAFTRPQKKTEEEVSISKEKKICLVCKKKLSKHIYLCSECGAFYCIKCSEALKNLKNACWVCNAPFDDSKPSKPYETIETGIQIDPKDK